jgi:hypothetical protein
MEAVTKRLMILTCAGALGLAPSMMGQAPMGRGRGGAPMAMCDHDKDGKCDRTGKPAGECQAQGPGCGRGGMMAMNQGRGWGMRPGMGRGMGRGMGQGPAAPQVKPPAAAK